MPGRPKKSRNKDANEKCRDPTLVSRKGRSNKCGICKQPGHKKATCKQKNGIASGTATQTASGTATQAASATQTAFVSQTGSGTASGNATQTASATQTDSASQTKTGTASKTQTATASKRSKTQVGTTSKPKTDLKPHQQSGITSPSRMLLELNEPDIWKREFDPLERREAIDFGISIPGFSIWEVNGVRFFNLG
ncbi:hypothetical protein TSUD_181680 [Trifolium subterraneum]|uniref:CCHC-type domain-containing protein n=1 Tax=Trifolium subterraneum TaxID=3900 RepID=A0A2Z6PD50_TRISU|nr:hypothetical protein TSUD_181680 [Trifolium subterraneum]